MEIITHLTTPFYLNTIDLDVFGFSVDRQARYNVDGVHVAGWWGEKSTITDEEHLLLAKTAVESADGRIKVYASAGSNDSKKSESMASSLLSLGVDGITLTMPYYNKGVESEIVATAIKIKDKAQEKRVFFFYDSDRELSQSAQDLLIKENIEIVKANSEWELAHYDGDEHLLSALCVDRACFSYVACLFPSAIIHIKEAWERKDIEKVNDLYFDLNKKIKILKQGGVSYLKYALSLWGLSYPSVRLPYIECDDDEKELIRCFFD